MNKPEESLVLKSYDLLKFCIPTLDRLPRSRKFTLGDRIHAHLSDLLETMIEAYYLPVEEKLPILNLANIKIEKIRYFFRLGHDLGHYSAGHLAEMSKRLDEIGRRTGGWIKAVKKNIAAKKTD